MKIKNLTFWIMAFMFSSCSYEFELNDINVGEKIVLYCMPCADKDTTLIQLSRSVPVSKKESCKMAFPMPESILW